MDETPAALPVVPNAVTQEHQPHEDAGVGRGFRSRLAWLFAWGTKGGLALTDQALFAGAQFILNILLARWLLPAEYGAFAVVYSIFILAAAIHSALLTEPMIIFGPGRHFKDLKSYLGMVLRGHWFLTIPAGFLLFGASFVVGRVYSRSAEQTMWVLGIVLPLALLPWLTRRIFYIDMRPGRSAAGSAVYFCSLLGLVWWLRMIGEVTPATAIGAMGVAALVSGGLQLMWARPQWISVSRRLTLKSVASEHWNYGRWILASAIPSWMLLNLYYLALPAWFGLKAAGILKALANLAMPAGHIFTTLGTLTLALLVQHREKGGLAKMRQTVRRLGGLFITGSILYIAMLWFFRIQILHVLYGGRYLEYSNLPLFLVCLIPLTAACRVTLGAPLRVCERPDRIFWGYLAGGVLAVSVGLWLAATWGVTGALMGCLASYGTVVGAFWLFYRKLGSESASA